MLRQIVAHTIQIEQQVATLPRRARFGQILDDNTLNIIHLIANISMISHILGHLHPRHLAFSKRLNIGENLRLFVVQMGAHLVGIVIIELPNDRSLLMVAIFQNTLYATVDRWQHRIEIVTV